MLGMQLSIDRAYRANFQIENSSLEECKYDGSGAFAWSLDLMHGRTKQSGNMMLDVSSARRVPMRVGGVVV